MDRFGAHWVRHPAKIEQRWRERVAPADVVLVPGDISWAMRMEQARPDLEFLAALPGRKVLLRGNHDYWWSSAAKVRAALPPGMEAVQGDVLELDGVLIAGTRLWEDRSLDFTDVIAWTGGRDPLMVSEEDAATTDRIFQRELGRLRLAVQALAQLARRHPRHLRIVITHYPPVGPRLEPSAASALIEQSGARHAVFGHLHALKPDLDPPLFGTRAGVTYHLTSCDYVDFTPVLIAEV